MSFSDSVLGAGQLAPTVGAASAPASGTAATTPAAPVALAEAAEAVQATITMARSAGMTHARIELSPESLGDIQIHLQHTADGLIARVITAHPEAAQTLQAGSDELRRSLEQNGTTLLRLDISTSGRGEREPASQQEPSSNPHAGVKVDEEEPTTQPTSPERGAGLSGSALVNVLA